ncbi:MAG TPA: hypothetical protein VFO51_06535, partial [Sphingomicrobium sp.]|nr:hypothetical protein [Sphingomicrobium sp.]
HRLDKRCDRAEERGSRHLALVARWDEWLALVGKGAEQEAAALLETQAIAGQPVQHCQKCQIPERPNPTAPDWQAEEVDVSDRCWLDDDMGEKVWMTDFPPPTGFTGYQSCDWGDPDRIYKRECTQDEIAILEADRAAARAAERAEEEALRDSWFKLLKDEASPPPSKSGKRAKGENERQ